MTLNLTVAAIAARAAEAEITTYDVNVGALTMCILHELRRQERAYFDRLNDEANRNVAIGPEEECPV